MYRFSIVSDGHANPNTYFLEWERWFSKAGIKAEVRKIGRGWALFREGHDNTLGDDPKKYKKTNQKVG